MYRRIGLRAVAEGHGLPIRLTTEFHSVGTSSSSAGDIPATFEVHTERIDLAASPPSSRLALFRGTRRAERPTRGPALQRIARALLAAPVRHLWPLQLSGYDQVPTTGPAILCPNHLSFFDSVFMMMTLDRPVYFIGKAEYLDSWKTRRLFPAMGMIPIDRDNGTRAMVALEAATSVLRQGALVCVFPEGSRSRDGLLHRGYPGAARLATSVNCPILPVGIVGTDQIQPPGARLPRPGLACSITIGRPLTPSLHEGAGRKLATRELTDQLMQRIAHLTGQEYVASYTRRPGSAAPPASLPRRRVPIVGRARASKPMGPRFHGIPGLHWRPAAA